MRQSWTDDHLDDLSHRMELRVEIKEQGRELRSEIAGVEARLRTQASEHFARTGEELAEIQSEMNSLQRTIIRIVGGLAISLVATLFGLLISSF